MSVYAASKGMALIPTYLVSAANAAKTPAANR